MQIKILFIMSFNSDQNETNSSVWNPFAPTKRDIERTDKLAEKNPAIAGLLSFLFLPGAMIYMNRGINNLKIIGYVFVIAFSIGILAHNKSEEETTVMGNVVGIVGNIAIIVENTRTITLARKRQSENNF